MSRKKPKDCCDDRRRSVTSQGAKWFALMHQEHPNRRRQSLRSRWRGPLCCRPPLFVPLPLASCSGRHARQTDRRGRCRSRTARRHQKSDARRNRIPSIAPPNPSRPACRHCRGPAHRPGKLPTTLPGAGSSERVPLLGSRDQPLSR